MNYLPLGDAPLQAWALNFSTLLTAAPATYGLLAGDAVIVAGLYATYAADLIAATDPTTRTPVTVAAKDVAKISLVASLRGYSVTVSRNPAVLDADKVAIGVTVRDLSPTRIPPPATAPLLACVGSLAMEVHLQIVDTTTPLLKTRPPGTVGCELWGTVGTVPPVGPTATNYQKLQTRCDGKLTFDAGDVGKTLYLYGRWINPRGEPGPWSARLDATIAA